MQKEYNISLDIYELSKIQEWISAFVDIADIVLTQNILTIQSLESNDVDEVFNEFMNYILSL